MQLTINISERLEKFFLALVAKLKPTKPTIEGGRIMYVVKADTPNQEYSIEAPSSVTDSEGNRVNVELLEYEVTSDNPAAVELVPDEDGEPRFGTVKIGGPDADGQPAVANINVLVKYKGTVLGSFGAQFTVTAGDPAAISGGSITFPGLSEAGEEPTEGGGGILDGGSTEDGGSLPSDGSTPGIGEDQPLPGL